MAPSENVSKKNRLKGLGEKALSSKLEEKAAKVSEATKEKERKKKEKKVNTRRETDSEGEEDVADRAKVKKRKAFTSKARIEDSSDDDDEPITGKDFLDLEAKEFPYRIGDTEDEEDTDDDSLADFIDSDSDPDMYKENLWVNKRKMEYDSDDKYIGDSVLEDKKMNRRRKRKEIEEARSIMRGPYSEEEFVAAFKKEQKKKKQMAAAEAGKEAASDLDDLALDLSKKKSKKGKNPSPPDSSSSSSSSSSEDEEMEVEHPATSWVDDVCTPSDYEGDDPKPRPQFTYSEMANRDLTDIVEVLKTEEEEEKKKGREFVYPLSPVVREYLNVIAFLTSKKNEAQRKVSNARSSEERRTMAKKVKAIDYMQVTLVKKIRPIFPHLEIVYPIKQWEKRVSEASAKKRKANEGSAGKSSKKKKDDRDEDQELSDSDAGGDEYDNQRGRVKDEELFQRKRVVESLKGEHKKKVFFQLNPRWSIYSDEAVAHRGVDEKFDVITICRQPLTPTNSKQQKSVKAYKMSFPIGQVRNIYLLLKNVVESYVVGDKASLQNIDACKIKGYEHNFNFGLLKASGYASTIFQADYYDCKVGWVAYRRPVDNATDDDKNNKSTPVVPTVGSEQEGENKQFLALVIRKKIPRSLEERRAARKAGKPLSTAFSIDIPITLIPRVYTAFAYIYRLNGGDVPLEYPKPVGEQQQQQQGAPAAV